MASYGAPFSVPALEESPDEDRFKVGGAIVVLVLILVAPNVTAQRQATRDRQRTVSEIDSRIYHDGRFATLRDVLDHYGQFFGLKLTEQETAELSAYLKSL